MDEAWSKLIQDTLEDGVRLSGGAVPGARLRQLIVEAASKAGLNFPPDENQSFSNFLESFPTIALVQRRPGRDMLVVPASRADLLTSPPDLSESPVLRSDIFEALTRISPPDRGPLYLRNTDSILWPEPGVVWPEDAVQLPASNFEQALTDRKEFASQFDPDLGKVLKGSLSEHSPLRSFSEAVKAHGLARRWHTFRVGKLLKQLQTWSLTNSVPWQSSWLTQGGESANEVLRTGPSSGQATVQEFFAALSAVIKETDLARISIPLDLVVKAWNRKA